MGRNKSIDDDEVLAIARDVFQRQGHEASTRDVAAAAGVSQAVLFQRFGSKEELFFRAMRPDALDVDALFAPYPPDDALDDLLALSERVAAYMRRFLPTLLKVMAVPGLPHERLRAWHDELPFPRLAAALTRRLERLAADGLIFRGDAHAQTMALLSAIHATVMFESVLAPRPHHAAGGALASVIRTLWDGLRPATPPRPRPRPRAR